MINVFGCYGSSHVLSSPLYAVVEAWLTYYKQHVLEV